MLVWSTSGCDPFLFNSRIDSLLNIKCKLKSQNIKDIQSLIMDIRGKVRSFNGYSVVEKSEIPHKKDIDVWGHLPESFPLMKKIKSEFDPVNIINTGRFIGGI